jgi:hypothetical protein
VSALCLPVMWPELNDSKEPEARIAQSAWRGAMGRAAGFDFRDGQKVFLYSTASRPSLLSNGYQWRDLSPGA